MADKVIMPQLGESIAEGTIVRWLKKPGDDVKKDEDLLVISTDKVEAEIPAPSSGVLLSIAVEEGKTVAVGSVLGYVGQKGEASPGATASQTSAAPAAAAPTAAPAPAVAAPAPAAAAAPAAATTSGRFVSPLVRKIAIENAVADRELDALAGTGQNGRVTKKDLQHYVQAKRDGTLAAPAPTARPAVASASMLPQPAPQRPAFVFPGAARELVQPASSMRKAIMKNMVGSKQTSAHVHTFFDVDWTRIDNIRRKHKDNFKKDEGVNLTYTVFMAAAIAQALKRHPYVNAEVRGTDIVFKKDIHLGMAVALDQPEPGLMVPVIKNADQLNVRGLAHQITDLALRARTKKVKPDELMGSTFTLTNPGNYGAIIGTPVINQPNVAILGMGRIQKQPVVLDVDGTDVLAIRNMSVISLGFDHRLIDGATADQFMADVKHTLEAWNTEP